MSTKQALSTRRYVAELVVEEGRLSREQIDSILAPHRLAGLPAPSR
jgi:aspartate ammonia-lyase